MSGGEERTDRAIAAALRELESSGADDPTPEEMRPWRELLGLLPQALEPERPSAGLRAELLGRVGAERGDDGVLPFKRVVTEARQASPRTHWIYRVAAVLALLLLGVAAKQAVDLADSRGQLTAQSARMAELQEVLDSIRSRSLPGWMTASGTELCELRPQSAANGGSKGWLFVRSDHQHWYVAAEGLAPAPEGQIYELWFRVGDESVSGGQFQPDANGRASLTSETMPAGITGIAITLEPLDENPAPSDIMVMYGEEVMLTL